MVRKGKSTSQAPGETPVLAVTAQQSRFHTDAETSTAIKEIVVKDLSISIGNRELLSHADLHLQPGRHYILIGCNGTGKSSLLTAISAGQVPGIPQAIRTLLLNQTHTEDSRTSDTTDSAGETVVQHVVRADKEREMLLYEAQALSEAAESPEGSTHLIRVYRQLVHQRLERDMVDVKRTAARRSGVRGLEARKELIRQEERIVESRIKLDTFQLDKQTDEQDLQQVAAEVEEAYAMLTAVQSALEATNAYSAEARARSVLIGLGFSSASLDQPVSSLSGGWQTRCRLACALCQSSDLLLLDEPSNGLDLPSIIWLENYLQNLDPSVILIVVTHDRTFADAVGEELLCLREQKLEQFRGSLSGYELARLKTYKHLERMKDAREKQKKHMLETIDNAHKAAKRAGDDKKLKQAASRKKKVEERMGIEVSTKGTRFKLNRDLAGYHVAKRADIELPTFDPPPRMSFSTTPAELRFPGALLSFEDVTYSYASSKQATPVLQHVNLTMHLGDRVGLAGLNGSGKSTLVKLAIGALDANAGPMILLSGTITRHSRARFGLYSQRSVEELNGIAAENTELTALSHLQEMVGSRLSDREARGVLSSLGLIGRVASEVPISLLSGGQKVRLALAKILWNPPHLLILDEVTTHLDSDTIQALAVALKRYEGAILLVTHDRFFTRCVVEGESSRSLAREHEMLAADDPINDEDDEDSDEGGAARPGVVYRLLKSKLIKLEGGMQEYEQRAQKASSKLGNA